jgi:hypothetical protein
MRYPGTSQSGRLSGIVAALFLCLSPLSSPAADEQARLGPLFGLSKSSVGQQPFALLPIQNDHGSTGLAFDLGGSENRKLELQLSKPLTVNVNSGVGMSSSGVGSMYLDSSINFQLNDNFDITSSLGADKSRSSFQPLGSIHCQNGVLESGSYHAYDCYFINQANILQQDQVALGLRYSRDNINSAISMFRNESALGQSGVINDAKPVVDPILSAGLMTRHRTNPLLPMFAAQQEFNYLSGETSGLDMEFQLGLTTDSAGDIHLGLQLTRVFEANYDVSSAFAPSLQNWTISSPFDSAKLNFDWSKGSFSGGLQGYYREQVKFLNGEGLDSSTTFDVHFTWRAPWNASLSLGTSNVLGAGSEKSNKPESGLRDPFESVYGRIPYVRYQQDL